MQTLFDVVEELKTFSIHFEELKQYILDILIRVLQKIREHLDSLIRNGNVISMHHLNKKLKKTTFLHCNLQLCQPLFGFEIDSFVYGIRGQVVFYNSIKDLEQIEFITLSIETLHHVLNELFDDSILIVFIGLIKHVTYFPNQVCDLII